MDAGCGLLQYGVTADLVDAGCGLLQYGVTADWWMLEVVYYSMGSRQTGGCWKWFIAVWGHGRQHNLPYFDIHTLTRLIIGDFFTKYIFNSVIYFN